MVTFESRDVAQEDGNALLGLAHVYNSSAKPVSLRGSATILNVARQSFLFTLQSGK